VAFFEDFEEIMPCSGIERFEAPVIKDEELHAPKRPHTPLMTGFETSRETAQIEADSALFRLLSVGSDK
jgi:hypothetical protein